MGRAKWAALLAMACAPAAMAQTPEPRSRPTAHVEAHSDAALDANRQALEPPRDVAALSSAIATDRERDLEGLFAQPETRRPKHKAEEAASKASFERHRRLATLSAQIGYCRSSIPAARRVIMRERRLAATSGYWNIPGVRQAGQTIAYCEEAGPKARQEFDGLMK